MPAVCLRLMTTVEVMLIGETEAERVDADLIEVIDGVVWCRGPEPIEGSDGFGFRNRRPFVALFPLHRVQWVKRIEGTE